MARIEYELRDNVAVLRWDDGKANTVSPDLLVELNAALDRVQTEEAKALVLAGRPGRFCAGFDLGTLSGGDKAASAALVRAGAELALRLYGFPTPTIIACTGHALGMGAVLLLSADLRFGASAEYKIALNESAIGMFLPTFGIELARDRLSKRHLTRSAIHAEIHSAASAVDAGFLDRVAPSDSLLEDAVAEGARLAAYSGPHMARTRLSFRQPTIDVIRASLDYEFPVQ
jgi:enoyl-CoA hydratase